MLHKVYFDSLDDSKGYEIVRTTTTINEAAEIIADTPSLTISWNDAAYDEFIVYARNFGQINAKAIEKKIKRAFRLRGFEVSIQGYTRGLNNTFRTYDPDYIPSNITGIAFTIQMLSAKRIKDNMMVRETKLTGDTGTLTYAADLDLPHKEKRMTVISAIIANWNSDNNRRYTHADELPGCNAWLDRLCRAGLIQRSNADYNSYRPTVAGVLWHRAGLEAQDEPAETPAQAQFAFAC